MRLYLYLIVIVFFALNACREEKNVKYSALPERAQTFLNSYFQNEQVAIIKRENRKNYIYDVILHNGTEIDFDKVGNWTNIDCKFSKLPHGIAPESIIVDLESRHPDSNIVKISKEIGGYEVTISAFQKELIYNSHGVFIRYDFEDSDD